VRSAAFSQLMMPGIFLAAWYLAKSALQMS
jgi:hypothetical protein